MSTAAFAVSQRRFARPSNRASNAALRAWMPPVSTLRPLALARGNVLRIRDGAGTVVHVRFGIVWITEEHSRHDAIVRQGESHAITHEGLAIVHADRDSRLVLEFRGASASEACLELAAGYGEPGRPFASHRCPASLAERVTQLAQRARRALAVAWTGLAPQTRWHRDEHTMQREAHTPEGIRHRLLHESRDAFPHY